MKIKPIYLFFLLFLAMSWFSCHKIGIPTYSDNYYRTDYTINNETAQSLRVVFGGLLNGGGMNPYSNDSIRYVPAGEYLTIVTQFTDYRIESAEEAVKTFGKLYVLTNDSTQSQTDFLQPQFWQMKKVGSSTYEAILTVYPTDF